MRISDWSSDVCSSDLIEGNPQHAASLGSTDVFAQATVLDVWDPDRSQAVLKNGEVSTWGEATSALVALAQQADAGAGLHLLTGALASRSEEHTSELQSLMRISYAVLCLKQKKEKINN